MLSCPWPIYEARYFGEVCLSPLENASGQSQTILNVCMFGCNAGCCCGGREGKLFCSCLVEAVLPAGGLVAERL